jgi:hypothetical protein
MLVKNSAKSWRTDQAEVGKNSDGLREESGVGLTAPVNQYDCVLILAKIYLPFCYLFFATGLFFFRDISSIQWMCIWHLHFPLKKPLATNRTCTCTCTCTVVYSTPITREITRAGTSTTWGHFGCIFKASSQFGLRNILWFVFYVRLCV